MARIDMTHSPTRKHGGRSPVRFLILFCLFLSVGCSGGGGSGGGTGAPAVISIETSSGTLLWSGTTALPPNCPLAIALNDTVIFTFSRAIDAASLPALGDAVGAINVTRDAAGTAVPARGGFQIQDDPTLPAGNARRVAFFPAAPTATNPVSGGGLLPGAEYTIFLPDAATGAATVTSGGVGLESAAITCFTACGPGPVGCFGDGPVGAPFVESTLPATSDPAPAAIAAGSITQNTFSLLVSEALSPESVDISTVALVNVSTGAQLPGSVTLFQAGTPEAGLAGSRIDYVATGTLPGGATYQLVINGVTALNGDPLELYDPALGAGVGERLFVTIPDVLCPQPAWVEDFTTTTNLGSVGGLASWTGNGQIEMSPATGIFGDGSFGALSFNSAPITLDTEMPAVPGFSNGTYDTTAVTVPPGALIRVFGAYPLHFRSLGSITLDGTIDGSAGTDPMALPGDPEQGPQAGAFNNGGSANNAVVLGGVGNAGGGDGGSASQSGYATRTPQGESGFGPSLAGLPNSGPLGANDFFGGGTGGDGGFRFPSGGISGERGGLGGAGGSAFFAGEDGEPHFSQAAGCTPGPFTVQVFAASTGVPPVFVSPISQQSAGSGGGGGGDRFETTGPTNDDQGGGGGGGGGGFRASCLGDLVVSANAILDFRGATGSPGNLFFGGGGGGGSGGQVWLQTPLDLTIDSNAVVEVAGGSSVNNCTDHQSGAGGDGLIQFEDSDGMINTSFVGGTGANVIALQSPLADGAAASATSEFFDTGYGATDFTSATSTSDLGGIPGATVEVLLQGAHELTSGGAPDLQSLSSTVTLAQIDQLDGYRYIRFLATLTYPLMQGSLPTGTPPSLQEVSISFQTPANCTQ